MTTIEKIRTEIEEKRNVAGHFDTKTARAQVLALSWVIDLIDKYAEQEPCDDAVSKEAIEKISQFDPLEPYNSDYVRGFIYGHDRLLNEIRKLPSVRPQEQTGHWIIDKGSLDALYGEVCKCSECGFESIGESNFCPYCGAKMFEPQESEEQTE